MTMPKPTPPAKALRHPLPAEPILPECGHPVAAASARDGVVEASSRRRPRIGAERKLVTVLFATSRARRLIADRAPEEARKLLDPGLRQCERREKRRPR